MGVWYYWMRTTILGVAQKALSGLLPSLGAMTIQKFYRGLQLLDTDHNHRGCFLTSSLLVHMTSLLEYQDQRGFWILPSPGTMTIQKFYRGLELLDVDHNPWGCFLTSSLLVHMTSLLEYLDQRVFWTFT
jgi:hypothetical protein